MVIKTKNNQNEDEDKGFITSSENGMPKQLILDGNRFPPMFKPEDIRYLRNFRLRHSDIVISTFPKSGTTWIQHIVLQLLRIKVKVGGKELSELSPMLGSVPLEYLENLESPRILKSHLKYGLVPKSKEAKYIFCCRNPKSVVVSNYHFLRNYIGYNFEDGKFETIFNFFMTGKQTFGDYFTHLKEWMKNEEGLNVLNVTYEDLIDDLEGQIKRIGQFLGGKALEAVSDMDTLRSITANSHFSAMSENQGRWCSPGTLHDGLFLRKGSSRDWRNSFTKEQSETVDRYFQRRLEGTEMANWWIKEMEWKDGCVREYQQLQRLQE